MKLNNRFNHKLNIILNDPSNEKYIKQEDNNTIIIFKKKLNDFKEKVLKKYFFNTNHYNFFSNLKKLNYIKDLKNKEDFVFKLDNKIENINDEEETISKDILEFLKELKTEKLVLNDKLNNLLIYNKKLLTDNNFFNNELLDTKKEFNQSIKKLIDWLFDLYYKKNKDDKPSFINEKEILVQPINLNQNNLNNVTLNELINKIKIKDNDIINTDNLNKLNFFQFYQMNTNNNLNFNNINNNSNNYLKLENSLNDNDSLLKFNDIASEKDSNSKHIVEISETESNFNID